MVVKSAGPARLFGSVWLRIRFPSRAENAHVVAVLVERMLPASLADDAQKNLFARMHVRIAVVGLMGILNSVVWIHVIRHGAAVDHEVRRMVRLGRNRETACRIGSDATSLCLDLRFCLRMNVRIHLGELEQIFAVVAASGVVVGRMREPEIILTPEPLRNDIVSLRGWCSRREL